MKGRNGRKSVAFKFSPQGRGFALVIKKQADEGTRTRDLLITNELLYQLSYIGLIFIIILYQIDNSSIN